MTTTAEAATGVGGSAKLQGLQKTYEKIKQLENAYQQEISRLEIDWLNLCSLIKQQDTDSLPLPKEPLFKEAADLNAIPIKLDLQENPLQSPKLEVFFSKMEEEDDDSYDED